QLRRSNCYVVIDFHGFRETNLITWWSGAPQRWGLKRADQSSLPFCFNRTPVLEDKGLHVSQMFVRVVDKFAPAEVGSVSVAPPIVIPTDAQRWAEQNVPNTFAVLYVDAPVKERLWPMERFTALADYLARKQQGDVVMVTGSQQPRPTPPNGVRILSDLTIPRLAATIGSAKILVSNDTGPMHLGPALGIPTVGIFSVGFPIHFRPTGPSDAY